MRIPREFELEGNEAILHKDGDRFIVEPDRKGRLLALLDTLKSIDETFPYAELRTSLEKRGTPIGPNDMLIAAHALALDCIVITANVSEFTRVPGLRVENWLE